MRSVVIIVQASRCLCVGMSCMLLPCPACGCCAVPDAELMSLLKFTKLSLEHVLPGEEDICPAVLRCAALQSTAHGAEYLESRIEAFLPLVRIGDALRSRATHSILWCALVGQSIGRAPHCPL